ncbi:uncharacterized protein KY384_001048 [Bacidia gigantensis]|uniref:uncharacterized protein n=1 Tax=Bacidia gigantensis TaxID=2732470 RepID=UPI001D03B55F|nr:uncharacterized protein KY384_001048 [Bacidia gigantensis]KAG8534204.1 hypothetical protein KY384_001048 [Bacidia gigantensis]
MAYCTGAGSIFSEGNKTCATLDDFKMKRNPRKLGWTKAFRHAHGKEMTVDTTLQLAARRNVPIRYNRDLVDTTVKAMERIEEIRLRRERVFYKKRMEGNKERQILADAKLVAENEHLLPRMRGSERKALEMEIDKENAHEVLEEIAVPISQRSAKTKQKMKRKLLVGGGTEDSMETE